MKTIGIIVLLALAPLVALLPQDTSMAILAIIILLVLVPMVLGIVIHYGLPRRDVEEMPRLRFYRAFAPLGDFAAMTFAVMVLLA